MPTRQLNTFIIAAVVFLVLPCMLSAAVTMKTPFTNNMVLQRNMNVPVWGTAAANEAVTITFNGKTKKATADIDGKWMVKLDSMPAGGPFTMTVKGSGNTVTLTNVLVGEVWICTGQSNMRQPLSNFPGYNPDEEAVGLGQVRMAILGKEKENWKVCDPVTVEFFSAVGFFFGRELYRSLDIPIGLIQTAIGGTSLESWMSPAGVDESPDITWGQKFPGGAVGGNYKFLEPSIPFGIRGAIWYQGENNGNKGTTDTYRDHFASLIKGWRQSWGQGDFPFLFVQLANYKALQTQPDPGDSWAMVREAQRLTLGEPATGMASAIDIGMAGDVHPINKLDVGLRLALNARALVYGESDLVYSGPIYQSMTIEDNEIRLKFAHTGRGLESTTGDNLEGFAIAGEDSNFIWADAYIDGNEVVVSNQSVPDPKFVLYGWDQNPIISLFNKEGLPASPFRTYGEQLPAAVFGCMDSAFQEFNENATIPDPNKWQSFQTIDEDGLLGERVDLWRNHRMWYMIESDFLLSGFESRPGTHAWQGEHYGKWLHAAVLAYEVTGDEKLKEEMDSSVRRLLATQLPNGYLGTYKEDKTFVAQPNGRAWDTWTHRYNLYGLLTYERFFPNKKIVDACKKMGDLLIEVYGEGKADLTEYGTRRGISAATLLESVMMLYERTLDKKYLDFAEHIVEMSENNPGLRLMGSMLENVSVVVPGQGKAYQMMANLLGYLRLYRCTGNEKYLKTVLNAWDQIKEEHLLTTGGPWSRHRKYNGNPECFAKPEDFHPEEICVEVCSSVTWMQLNIHLFELTGLAKYFNEVELTLNNALYQHQFTDGIDWNHHPKPNAMPQYVSDIRCCASSGPRGLEMYSSHLAGRIGDNLIINSLAPASIALPKEYGSGILNIKGDFPIKSSSEIHFETLKNKNFTVEFRLPANTTLAGVKINGAGVSAKENSRGFFELNRKWEKGDVLSIDVNYELKITNKKGEEGKNWFAITYGPITLAQQIRDISDEEPFDGQNISFDKPDEILKLLSPLGKPNSDNYFRVKNTDMTLIPYYMTPNRELGIRTYFQYN